MKRNSEQNEPEVFVIAYTAMHTPGLRDYLESIGVEWESDAEEDADELVEIAGRVCYKSFAVELNPNLTKIREGNSNYVNNLIAQQHGSVLEHANLSIMFHNVSRVFTHELVRHRAGMGYSQESLRYVRLDTFNMWCPCPELEEDFREVREFIQNRIQQKIKELKIDSMEFKDKKIWTSRLRRMVPMGVSTDIIATGNLRAWRHIFTMRSSAGAEEEAQLVMEKLALFLKQFAPNVFADLTFRDNKWELLKGRV